MDDLVFKLNIKSTNPSQRIYSKDLISNNNKIYFDKEILLNCLKNDEELVFEAKLKKGTAKQHAKWNQICHLGYKFKEDDQKNKPPVTKAVQTESADELAPKIKNEVMTQETAIVKPQIIDNAAASVQSANLIEDENSTSNENKIDNDSDGSRILVKALKNSWIQVRDNKAKKLLLTKLLRAGDSYSVPNQPDLVLLTGNAGALEILVDGKSVPGLGPPGTIRKNVILDPEKLRQGEAIR